MGILPANRPKATRITIEGLIQGHLQENRIFDMPPLVIVGVRGYFKDTMGTPGKNDRGIYDDAIFVMSERLFTSFNANVDPSVYRKGIATLKSGLWWYMEGIHGLSKPPFLRYKAFVQAAPEIVTRDGQGEDKGMFGINIHRGGVLGTSSLGCQTIPPSQWDEFFSTVDREIRFYGLTKIPYILVEAP